MMIVAKLLLPLGEGWDEGGAAIEIAPGVQPSPYPLPEGEGFNMESPA